MDADLLAQAMVTSFRRVAKEHWPFLRGDGWPAYEENRQPPQVMVVNEIAESVAAEYARLEAEK